MARILVVEDNAIVLFMMRDVLRFRGHEVLTAADVDDAFAQFGAAPALALVDIEIPGGGGIALLRRVRADERFSQIPLVAVTAHASADERARILDAGFDAFAAKPVDVRLLPRLVEEWMALRGGAPA